MNFNDKPKQEYWRLTWERVAYDCDRLARDITASYPLGTFPTILAITRGGLIPAGLLAQRLDIRFTETIGLRSYDRFQRDKIIITKEPGIETRRNRGKGVLVVDDLVDSGETIKFMRAILPEAHFAVLYTKGETERLVHWAADICIDPKVWMVMPWEKDPETETSTGET